MSDSSRNLILVLLVLMSLAALGIVVGLLLFPTACHKFGTAPPIKEGVCEVTSYTSNGSIRQQWCQYKGHWWICDEDGGCSQGKPLTPEAPQ